MKHPKKADTGPLKLNAGEAALASKITWNDPMCADMEKAAKLAERLLKRSAIPQVRLNYFLKPEMNIGGHGKSRRDVFESNGTEGKAILRHAHFLKTLKYWVFGPDLPGDTMQGFCEIIDDDPGSTDMILDQLLAFARKEVRQKKLDPNHAAEEFFKLSYEAGESRFAESVRSAAKQARR